MEKSGKPTYVVAVGASAGGLSPLQEFVGALPADLEDITIIIAQHLSPDYKSMLPEIISRKTRIPTTSIDNGVDLASNHIYVIPPNADAVVTREKIEIHKSSASGPRPSINKLFKSVADCFAESGAGIILSGTGQDGSEGIQAIKKAGGITISQDLSSSKYTGMPQSAMMTGMIDLILAPEDIGINLINLLHSENELYEIVDANSEEVRQQHDEISILLHLLESKLGTNFSNYKESTILRRLNKRISDRGYSSLKEYLKYIDTHSEELDEFFQYLLIGVTSFFRDEEAFKALRTPLKELLEKKEPRSKLRVWVPGCATGEESVSLAILIHELAEEIDREDIKIQIFATDIDTNAISQARHGWYEADKLQAVPKEWVHKYFDKRGEGYETNRDLRNSILYTRHDLTSNPPFLRLDMISCRNLFIYFKPQLQNQVFPVFQYALNPEGLLFLGKSENIGTNKSTFNVIDAKYRIFSRKDKVQRKPLKLPFTSHSDHQSKKETEARAKSNISMGDMIKDTLYNTFDYPYVVIDSNCDIVEVVGEINDFVRIKPGQATMNLLRLIVDELSIELRALTSEAIKSMIMVKGSPRRMTINGDKYLVTMVIKPLLYAKPNEPFFIVVFEHQQVQDHLLEMTDHSSEKQNLKHVKELEYELVRNKQHLNTLVEELETSNEELQALNEELQSSNEELQASNEELETSNEELQATNEELENAYVDLRNTAQDLSRQKDLMEQIYVTSPDLIAVLKGSDYIFEYANPAYKDLYPNHKLIGNSLVSLMPELMSQGFIEILNKVRETGKAYHASEVPVVMDYKKNGRNTERFFTFTYSPIPSMDEEAPDVIVYAIDVTEMVHKRRNIEESANFFITLAENIPALIWTMGEDGATSYVNERIEKQFNLSADEATHFDISQFIHDEDRTYVRNTWRDAKSKGTHFMLQARVSNGGNSYRWHLFKYSPITRDEDGRSERVWICTATDIQEQKEIEERKDTFMSIASHELKTPLTTVHAYVEMLHQVLEEEDVETARMYVEKSMTGLQRINLLVRDLLDITRIQTGTLAINKTTLNFNQLVHETVDNLNATGKDYKIDYKTARDGCLVEGDRNRLEQVLTNLISNAVKYSPKNEPVSVHYDCEGNYACVDIIDRGKGIPKAQREKIFDRFYRVDDKSDYAAGLGIGLYISRTIIERHGGEIAVRDNKPKGSIFQIRLPVYEEKNNDM